jgi:hypothetical protein
MASPLLPLNKFVNVAKKITTTDQTVYTVPTGISSIVLSAICVNYTANNVLINVRILKGVTDYFLIPNIELPANEVMNVISGRMVLTEGDQLIVKTDAADSVDFIMSLNESANE